MNALAAVLAASSLLSSLPATPPSPGSPAPAPACPEAPLPPAPPVDATRVQASLNELLSAEGLATTRAGIAVVRRVDLDGDPTTQEALVDVVSMEHCLGTCETLIVRSAPTGALYTFGHGKGLGILGTRSLGWVDLSVNTLPGLTVGALRFTAGRYR